MRNEFTHNTGLDNEFSIQTAFLVSQAGESE